jgi:anti-sigma regulatory factor (Ser/Thr protein kinase)/anti-anti-sigma regulatory factor
VTEEVSISRAWEDRGVIVVTPHGTLGIGLATTLRRVIAKCLAEEPAAVVVDLSDVQLERASGRILAVLARMAADRPATSFAVCGLPPEQVPVSRLQRFPVWATVSEAVEHASDPFPRRRVTQLLRSSARAPAQARALVVDTCRRWGVAGDRAAAAATVMSELVTNAVVHAGSNIRVGLELAGAFLIVTVRDQSPVPPSRRPARPGRESGRGLAIVAELSRSWGSLPVADDGKIVWAWLPSGEEPGHGSGSGSGPDSDHRWPADSTWAQFQKRG